MFYLKTNNNFYHYNDNNNQHFLLLYYQYNHSYIFKLLQNCSKPLNDNNKPLLSQLTKTWNMYTLNYINTILKRQRRIGGDTIRGSCQRHSQHDLLLKVTMPLIHMASYGKVLRLHEEGSWRGCCGHHYFHRRLLQWLLDHYYSSQIHRDDVGKKSSFLKGTQVTSEKKMHF